MRLRSYVVYNVDKKKQALNFMKGPKLNSDKHDADIFLGAIMLAIVHHGMRD
jgi:hypothetical protein